MRKVFITLLLIGLATTTALAIPAKPSLWKTIRLANGTEVRAQLRGDEHAHFWQDADGKCYTEQNGAFVLTDAATIAQRASARRAKVAQKQQKRMSKLMRRSPRKVGGATGMAHV